MCGSERGVHQELRLSHGGLGTKLISCILSDSLIELLKHHDEVYSVLISNVLNFYIDAYYS